MPSINAIEWDRNHLRLLDQTKLPQQQMVLEISDYRQVVSAIREMQVRGAPALGIAAAYGMALAAREFEADDRKRAFHKLETAAKEMNPDIKVYGAEPAEADDAYRSLQSGKIESNETINTICDGLRAQIGSVTFPIIKEKVDGIITVTEVDIIDSMRMIWERMKIIVEPSSSITLAAVLNDKEVFNGKKVGLILSGGNVDLDHMPW